MRCTISEFLFIRLSRVLEVFTLISAFMLAASIYLLARADGWVRNAALALSGAVIVIPMLTLFAMAAVNAPADLRILVFGLLPVGALTILLTLAKSVARRLESDRQPRDIPR